MSSLSGQAVARPFLYFKAHDSNVAFDQLYRGAIAVPSGVDWTVSSTVTSRIRVARALSRGAMWVEASQAQRQSNRAQQNPAWLLGRRASRLNLAAVCVIDDAVWIGTGGAQLSRGATWRGILALGK